MKGRVVLIGDLIPSSDKWSRIIEAGGGTSVHTKSTITQAVREFVKEDTEGMKVAVVPEGMKKNGDLIQGTRVKRQILIKYSHK